MNEPIQETELEMCGHILNGGLSPVLSRLMAELAALGKKDAPAEKPDPITEAMKADIEKSERELYGGVNE